MNPWKGMASAMPYELRTFLASAAERQLARLYVSVKVGMARSASRRTNQSGKDKIKIAIPKTAKWPATWYCKQRRGHNVKT
jgi:hypothetical protein